MRRFLILVATVVAGASGAAVASESSECRTLRDGRISRVEAPDRLTAYRCWGKLHAAERGAQMQVLRQTARGRLAEERGPEFLKGDFILRLLELERRAKKLEAELPSDDRELLQAYADGVGQGRAAIFSKDPWKVSDTLLLLLLQSFDQTRRSFEQDIVTDSHAREGHPLDMGFPWQTPILKPGEFPVDSESQRKGSKWAKGFPFAPQDEAAGSNNWVVAPKFSKSGRALLANDPHLQLKTPPFWHWMQIEWREPEAAGGSVRLTGAGLPGVPFIASGASKTLAWGLTNSYVDVADAVLVPRKGLRTRTIRPVVWVKKWGMKLPIFFKSFEITEGSDLPVLPIESPVKDHVVVVRWSGFDLRAAGISPLFEVARVKTVQEMDHALSRVELPSWNFVFADTTGGIGYRAVGRLPRRAWRERGTMEVLRPEQLVPYDVLSAEEAPHVLNPARGWIATANQLQWGPEGKFSVGSIQTESFRGFRIEELLKAGNAAKHSPETFKKIQCDVQAVDARFLLPVLLKGLPRSEVTDRLSRWNFEAGLECRECAVFRLWMKELGDPQWSYARAREGRSEFWIEAQSALDRALAKLRLLPGGPWVRWGDFHRATFPDVAALRPFAITNLGGALATAGDDHSVSPGSSDWYDSGEIRAFSQHSGASQRLVVELTSPPTVYFVLPGRSGLEGEAGAEEKATSPDRQAWAGCELKVLTSPSSSPGSSAESR